MSALFLFSASIYKTRNSRFCSSVRSYLKSLIFLLRMIVIIFKGFYVSVLLPSILLKSASEISKFNFYLMVSNFMENSITFPWSYSCLRMYFLSLFISLDNVLQNCFRFVMSFEIYWQLLTKERLPFVKFKSSPIFYFNLIKERDDSETISGNTCTR